MVLLSYPFWDGPEQGIHKDDILLMFNFIHVNCEAHCKTPLTPITVFREDMVIHVMQPSCQSISSDFHKSTESCKRGLQRLPNNTLPPKPASSRDTPSPPLSSMVVLFNTHSAPLCVTRNYWLLLLQTFSSLRFKQPRLCWLSTPQQWLRFTFLLER